MSGTETFVCSKDFVRNIYFCLKICDPKASANWIASIVDAKDRRSNGPFFPDFLVRAPTNYSAHFRYCTLSENTKVQSRKDKTTSRRFQRATASQENVKWKFKISM